MKWRSVLPGRLPLAWPPVFLGAQLTATRTEHDSTNLSAFGRKWLWPSIALSPGSWRLNSVCYTKCSVSPWFRCTRAVSNRHADVGGGILEAFIGLCTGFLWHKLGSDAWVSD